MNAITFGHCFKPWSRFCFGALAAVIVLAGANAFAQSTVTTLANTYNRAGAGKPSALGVGVSTIAAKFNFPAGIAIDPSGTYMFVADYNNSAIRYVYGVGDKSSSITFNIYNNKSGINHPIGMAMDSSNIVYVLNYGTKGKNGSLMVFSGAVVIDYAYIPSITTRATNLINAAGIALDYLNNAYITVQGNSVMRVSPLGVTTIVGVITNAKTSLTGIAYTGKGKLAISDAGNNGIWLMDLANTNLFSNATRLTGFHGANDILGPSAFAAFNHPQGIVQAGNGVLVIADYNNNQVKSVTTNGYVSRLFGVPSLYWKTVPKLVTKGWNDGTMNPVVFLDTVQSRLPYGLAIDASGNIYDTEDYYDLLRAATGTGLLPPPLPPPLPPILSIDATYGLVNLAWSTVATATNYNVKRSTTSGSETTIFSTPNTNYTDTNVLDGLTYYYAVSAVNTTGEGQNSAEVSGMPLFSPTPTNLIVTATNYGTISLAWAPSTGATSYNLKRSTSSGGPYTNIVNTASLIYADTGLANGATYYYVVSAVNAGGENPTNSSEISATVPTPPPPSPTIGWFDYENFLTVFHPVSGTPYISANDLNFAVVANVNGVNTKYTTDGSDPALTNGFTANSYKDGQTYEPPLLINSAPNLVIKAANFNAGGSSAIVTAVFQFVAGDPVIKGNNAAQFVISDVTIGAQFLYTTDGSDPRTNLNATVVGPANSTNGLTLFLQFPANTNVLPFSIVAFKANYQTSSVVNITFSSTNYVANNISFGLASGPGSCQYVASPGQSFVVPVSLSLLPDAPPIYGLQFNLTLTNLATNIVNPLSIDFVSLIGKPDATNAGFFDTIDPYEFISANQPNNDPYAFPYQGAWYQSLVFQNTNNMDLLGVGWLEVLGRTNLYNTMSQNLLTYPILRGNDPYPSSQIVIGGYYFGIPTNAQPGDAYQIQIGRPSATTYGKVGIGYGTSVIIDAKTDTNRLGAGSINALKNVTIGQIKYLVGDASPANWFNAGDFGKSNLVNLDVSRVFEFAAYPVGAPPIKSDLFDALDSCGNYGYTNQFGYYTNAATYPSTNILFNAVTNYTVVLNFDTNANRYVTNSYQPSSTNNFTNIVSLATYFVSVPYDTTNIFQPIPPALPFTNIVQSSYVLNTDSGASAVFNGNDTNINQIAFGDGKLDVCDVYVTFRRSLDSSLLWFQRFWTNGQRAADTGNTNHAAHVASKLAAAKIVQPQIKNLLTSSLPPEVDFTAGIVQGSAGQVVQVPITATISGNYNLRVLMLNLSVLPTAGAPTLTAGISFSPSALGAPTQGFTDNSNLGFYTAAWLDSTIAGVTGTVTIGTLSVAIPAGAPSGSSYTVNFDHASASPNGLASFPILKTSGTITVQ
jgi:hypothetical protein